MIGRLLPVALLAFAPALHAADGNLQSGFRPGGTRSARMSDVIQATSAPRPVGIYPHARRVGDLLFLSGIGPRDPATNEIVGNEYFADGRVRKYDIAAQTRAVFANVRAVLEASGAGW